MHRSIARGVPKIYPYSVSNDAWTYEHEQWLHQQASICGFAVAGVSPVAASSESLTAERFTAWIEAGRAGEMDYLKRCDDTGTLLRSDVRAAIPWARSVIVCGYNYNVPAPLSIDPAASGTGWIARYAWSGGETEPVPGAEGSSPLRPTDYHDELLVRLRDLEAALQLRLPCQTRCYVDTGPLIERAAAAQAGIGWIGKNTCVLNQNLGSWLLLGVIVTSLPVASTAEFQPVADRCGSCTRCLDACPTEAFIAPRQMDASRCISYLTIEKKGSIPEDLRPLIGRQVFGCDICQDVCPWNRRAPISSNPGMLPRTELINPQLDWLAQMDGPTFKRYFKKSPIERTRRKRLLRNVAIAMGNSGEHKFLPTLQGWSLSEDPVLAEAAQWALRQLEENPSQPASSPNPLLASE